MSEASHGAWPAVSPKRLAEDLRALTARVGEAELRAQLHALAALIEHLGAESRGGEERARLSAELGAARGSGAEDRVVALTRQLGALDRGSVGEVDWSAVSGG